MLFDFAGYIIIYIIRSFISRIGTFLSHSFFNAQDVFAGHSFRLFNIILLRTPAGPGLDATGIFRYFKLMPFNKRKRSFILYNLATTAAEEMLIAVGLLVILPRLGIKVPLWIVITVAVAWAVWSFFTYRLGVKVIEKAPILGAEALVGVRCKTVTPLSPTGYVQVGDELWKAYSTTGRVEAGIEVVIEEVKGLTLRVSPVSHNAADE
jgi:membrane protein implicated in regulation of membrane protease activity